ncbi:murein transglycosylase A [Magnetofaba australis]|uniref:peptidoglycan lytic exotransglycosylase n=1 Tax=Magnetofaba australis IT-1 TaxID=1434232 RepID=A0A1Y2K407_9PROT|nr:MltA domain-containing protein [Magnetofaba australis]OSM01775.1 putative MltA domain-containing protein [Magnetofaba australis IT-1]
MRLLRALLFWAPSAALGGVLWLLAQPEPPPPPPPPPPLSAASALEPIEWTEVGAFADDAEALKNWADALRGSAGYYHKRPRTAKYRFGGYSATAGQLAALCEELAQAAESGDPAQLHKALRDKAKPFRSVGSDHAGEVMVTGYYEASLKGSRTRSDKHAYPLYKKPDDLITVRLRDFSAKLPNKRVMGLVKGDRLRPYHDRAAIDDKQKLSGRGLELVWVDSPVDAFFLHIQGSGRVELAEGGGMRVGYAGANGRPYFAVGRALIENGAIPREKMSLEAIRDWLEANPQRRDWLLNQNPSYVFFRETEGGPYGNIGVSLTGGYSIATDHRLFPRGAPALLHSELPTFASADALTPNGWRPVSRLVVNQDTGGAIRGAGRVDWFQGYGFNAERTAGSLKQPGARLVLFAPKELQPWPEEVKPAPPPEPVEPWHERLWRRLSENAPWRAE